MAEANEVVRNDLSESADAKATGAKTIHGKTKMDMATEVYKQMRQHKNVTRKEIIERFTVEAHLSPAAASTYYQIIKARQGKMK